MPVANSPARHGPPAPGSSGGVSPGYDALMAGKEKVVGGSLKDRLQTAVAGVIPDSTKGEMHRTKAKPGSDE
ncbi:MAG: hypothetical protein J0H06_08375 [Actinobacteria bacterium]|nr:hypothetical protein [Actinomycetota bacterium]